MKTVGTILCALAGAIFCGGADAQGLKVFSNDPQGWSVSYPSDWAVATDPDGRVSFSKPGQALCVIYSFPAGPFASAEGLAEYQMGYQQDFMRQNGFVQTEISRKAITAPSGQTGLQILVAIEPGGRSLQTFHLFDGLIRMINCEGPTDLWEVLQPSIAVISGTISFR